MTESAQWADSLKKSFEMMTSSKKYLNLFMILETRKVMYNYICLAKNQQILWLIQNFSKLKSIGDI